jgi:hypothetical protein
MKRQSGDANDWPSIGGGPLFSLFAFTKKASD